MGTRGRGSLVLFFEGGGSEDSPNDIGNAKEERAQIHACAVATASCVGAIAAYGIKGMYGCCQNIGKDYGLEDVVCGCEIKQGAAEPADEAHAHKRETETAFEAWRFTACAFMDHREQKKLHQSR